MRLEAEPPHPAIQVGAIGRQPAGGLRHVAAGGGQRARDQGALEVVERLRQRHVRPFARRGSRRAVLGHDTRHVVRADRRSRCENREPLHQVRELAHVPRPAVRGEQLHGAGVEPHRSPQAPGLPRREMLHQRRNVLGPLAQRRDVHRQHVQPEQQVLAELSLLRGLAQVLVGRRDHAHLHGERPLATESLDHAGLEHAQQLRLGLEAQVADLVQEQRAAVGELEATHPPLGSARERTSLVAEHLRLDQVLRNGRAVDAHEALRRACALAVDRGGDELLARSRLAGDQHPRLGGRDARYQGAQLLHRRAHAHQRVGVAQRFVKPAILGQRARQLERGAQRGEHPFGRERLLEELKRAELGGAHRIGEVRLAAHHHHGNVGRGALELLQGRQSVRPARHHQVEQHGVGPLPLDGRQPRGPVGRFAGLEPLRLQQRRHHLADVGLVIHQQDARAHDVESTIENVAPPPGVSETVIVP
ncbi:MAG: hypothetical protein AUH12_01385 [Gemmatimonadetes bacterium 13_2_20CM_69_8]|nr:MAG: hypothetical protein AUH12_01385 [Gemmatimonadetes bacterium 13_2_20CM_69_8]